MARSIDSSKMLALVAQQSTGFNPTGVPGNASGGGPEADLSLDDLFSLRCAERRRGGGGACSPRPLSAHHWCRPSPQSAALLEALHPGLAFRARFANRRPKHAISGASSGLQSIAKGGYHCQA